MRSRRFAVLMTLLLSSIAGAAEPRAWLAQETASLLDLYQHLHQNPEISLQEVKTAARIAAELRAAGITEVTEHVGGTGVVALLRNGPGPTLMIRTDLDALPITEATGLPYASKVKVKTDEGGHESGAMHACGHDVHMTAFIAAARYLAAHRQRWSGTVMFVGQPAEERSLGAIALLKAGLYEKFAKPDFVIAMHNDPTIPLGKIGMRGGAFTSNSDSVNITLIGRGGHGAQPHTTIDPVVMAAHLVLDLQTVVSRERRATEPAVITVGALHAGTKHNIISDLAELLLTVRSYSPEMRRHLQDAIARKAKAVALAAGAPEPVISVTEGSASVINSEELTERLAGVFRKSFGDDNVLQIQPATWSEDFGYYRAPGVPICLFRVGSISEGRRAAMPEPVGLHSPKYYPDAEQTIHISAEAFISAALDLLSRGGR